MGSVQDVLDFKPVSAYLSSCSEGLIFFELRGSYKESMVFGSQI